MTDPKLPVLPDGVPQPPDGYDYKEGPLQGGSTKSSEFGGFLDEDCLSLERGIWTNGGSGTLKGYPYAIRRGTELHRLNFGAPLAAGEAADLIAGLGLGEARPEYTGCGCCECIKLANRRDILMTRMVTCPKCGNKRCPKAAWHGYQCTGSNEHGQFHVPEPAPQPAPPREWDGWIKVDDSNPDSIPKSACRVIVAARVPFQSEGFHITESLFMPSWQALQGHKHQQPPARKTFGKYSRHFEECWSGYVIHYWRPMPSSPDESRLREVPAQGAGVDALTIADYEQVLSDHRRLVRELDVACFGDGAAPQASLCDLVKRIPDALAAARAEGENQELRDREAGLRACLDRIYAVACNDARLDWLQEEVAPTLTATPQGGWRREVATLLDAVAMCDYECEAGPLRLNRAWQALVEMFPPSPGRRWSGDISRTSAGTCIGSARATVNVSANS